MSFPLRFSTANTVTQTQGSVDVTRDSCKYSSNEMTVDPKMAMAYFKLSLSSNARIECVRLYDVNMTSSDIAFNNANKLDQQAWGWLDFVVAVVERKSEGLYLRRTKRAQKVEQHAKI